ncbi:hypothetical protein UFOVP1545_48 [uncultured Caudovirales phage]|uniref:Uncharacterized protein n=1 Tax=uncultured Caudovirales phage TaxID=2100421 RepID=A0A6J7XDC2_9CAUD|nr:hypothetical protein UFOVP1545_48 [uncultured Caudovirales phage]
MNIVTTIRRGHVIDTGASKFTVLGTSNIRGRYRYTVEDQSGRRASLGREDVLQAQREGHTRVI